MEHPLIGDISHLTQEQLSQTVSDLQKKLGMAQRTGNGHVADQIRMALETYYNAYQARLAELISDECTTTIRSRVLGRHLLRRPVAT